MTETTLLFSCGVCNNPLPHAKIEDQNYVVNGKPVCSFICVSLAEIKPPDHIYAGHPVLL